MAELSPDHLALLNVLSHAPQHIDVITDAASLPLARVSSLLVELELTDQVINVGGMKYVRK